MKYKTTIVLMLVIAFSVACDRVEKLTAGFPTPPPETTTPAKELVKLALKPDAELEKQIAKIAEEVKGKVGVVAVVLETGDSVSLNADQHFPMQSVYKLPIAMAVLHEVDDEKFTLDEQIGVTNDDFVGLNQHSPIRDKNPNGSTLTVRELIQFSVSESDGTASDVLMRLAGGPDAVQTYLAAIGVRDMAIINTEKELALNWQTQYANFATPNGAITLLRNLQEGNGVSPANRELLLKFMTDSTPGAKRLKGLLPAGTSVAHKTGTSGTQNGITAATNDIGIIILPNGKHIAIAVFVSDSAADEKPREPVIAKIGKAVWDRWNGGDEQAITTKSIFTDCQKPENDERQRLCSAVVKASGETDKYMIDGLKFLSRKVDLNGDKIDETVVWAIGDGWGGTSGYPIYIFSSTKNNYRKIWELDQGWPPIVKLKSKTKGWYDLAYMQGGGGADWSFVKIKYDGKTYRVRYDGKNVHEGKVQIQQPDGEVLIEKEFQQTILGPIPNQR